MKIHNEKSQISLDKWIYYNDKTEHNLTKQEEVCIIFSANSRVEIRIMIE